MQFARVTGNCVCTVKDAKLPKEKLLVIQPVDSSLKKAAGSSLVAIDVVGAGCGELVLFVSGSSARQTTITENKPTDCTVMAIVDYVEKDGDVIFSKNKE
ncbi:EutN/CcmL family microcompartment protein [bacterium]|nr:ethanolamine utilization protein EutN [bacterium]MBU3955946.1 EutN/CcmL family microcompartment protein [bacterium]MBU4134412.1 EutN/CcmL family microcompartment protein [bacterium]